MGLDFLDVEGLSLEELKVLTADLTDEEVEEVTAGIPPHLVDQLLASESDTSQIVPDSPAAQAVELDDTYVAREHLTYLSDRIAQAVKDVENGTSRFLAVSMPPRSGKTTMTSYHTPLWILRKHPDWPIALVSHDDSLVTSWGRAIRRTVESKPELGIAIAPDSGAVKGWETDKGGMILSRTWRGPLTGRGIKALIIDDATKDFAEAQSEPQRQALWEWWLSTAQTRFEPPVLVLVVQTRWHEDDFIGRIASKEYEGDPAEFEFIRLPALAEEDDLLKRQEGEPLLSPIINETAEQAIARWEETKRAVGSSVFAAMYQQRPSPAEGAIFQSSWWRFWTTDPDSVSRDANGKPDGRVVLLDPLADLKAARWLDSWDCSFKAADSSDYVVGQRWAARGPDKFLMMQHRERMTFTETRDTIYQWAQPTSLYGSFVHERVIEDKANGTAVIDVLKEHVSGLIPINPTDSKTARARSVTPEFESGHVYLPHPSDPGNGWVYDLISEFLNFPNGTHDDQVDATSQALARLRTATGGSVTVPGSQGRPGGGMRTLAGRSITKAATTGRKYTGGMPRRT